jgi:hypothetical protein
MMKGKKGPFSYTIASIAKIYDVSRSTMESRIAAFQDQWDKLAIPVVRMVKGRKKQMKSNILSAKQIQLLVDKTDQPPCHTWNGKRFVPDEQ